MGKEFENRPAKPLFVTNPVVLNYTKRYILGTTHDSLKLFFRLCNMRIYVDGFVDDDLDGMTIYHKKIYKAESLVPSDSILLTPDSAADSLTEITVCSEPVIINPEIIGTDIYIYGAGNVGRKLLDFFQEDNIAVRGFIDSDPEKINGDISGVKIYASDILKSLGHETAIIEAGKYYKEIDLFISEQNKTSDRYYFADMTAWREDAVYVEDGISFDGIIFCDGEGDFGSKAVYLCGRDYNLAYKYYELFKILDFENVCIAKWAEELGNDNEEMICCVEDALLEKDFILIFYESITKKDLQNLNSLELKRGKDFCDIRCNMWEGESCLAHHILDINLGNTRDMGSDFPGIAVYGDNCKDDYKIAVLGGSSSTSGFFRLKSWPQIMYENYCNNHTTVFNGAVEGYASGQQLIKLMRDIVWLKPDLVIAFNGGNDILRDGSYNIFYMPYINTIMEYADKNIVREEGTDRHDIFRGISPSANVTEVWLKNIEYMNAVCEINHIRFLSFMEPLFFSKAEMVSKAEIIIKKKYDYLYSTYPNNYADIIKSQIKEFKKAASALSESHKYIHDLSGIFDREEAYIDSTHISEKGNMMIAQEIYKVINRERNL